MKPKDIKVPLHMTTEFAKTDSTQLDEMLGGGLSTDSFIVIQGPTGSGKTSFMLRNAIKCLIAGKKVMYISCGEQSLEELLMKMYCMNAKIEYKGVGEGDYTEEELNKIGDSINWDRFDNLYMEYSEELFSLRTDNRCDMNDMLDTIRKEGIKYVFMDYLGACLAPTEDGQYSFLNRTASKLKNIATKDHLCIMTAMQTNRALKAELAQDGVDPASIDEQFMSSCIGVAQKATACISIFKYKGQRWMSVFKNRFNGKLGAIAYDTKPYSHEITEYFNPKEGY